MTWKEQGSGNLTLVRGDRAMLALEVWDPALDSPVQGLTLTAARGSEGPVPATPSRPGVYLFPGLRSLERLAPGDRAGVQVQVRDPARRYAPAGLALTVWFEESGALQMLDGQGGQQASPRRTQLYSDPNRDSGASLAVVRGELWDREGGTPAAFGVVAVRAGGQTFTGAADSRGMFLVAVVPPPVQPSLDPGATGPPSFPVTVAVRYAPTGMPVRAGCPPDLADLGAQAPGVIFADASQEGALQISAQLVYGSELVLRSKNSSRLLIGTRRDGNA
jgi:hypothetical protein